MWDDMSTLTPVEKRDLEILFGMSSGYVYRFTNQSFRQLIVDTVGHEVETSRYTSGGSSKADRLRTLWNNETDELTGRVLAEILEMMDTDPQGGNFDPQLFARCRRAVGRLMAGTPSTRMLKSEAERLDLPQLRRQVRRLEESLARDPALAVGTAKELVETVCKTILSERGKPVQGHPDLGPLVRSAMLELHVDTGSGPPGVKGAEVTRRLLGNLASLVQGIGELRNLQGTGHGPEGRAESIPRRHAALAVGSAIALSTFLLESHAEQKTHGSSEGWRSRRP